jgi:hypothetical protein
MARTVALTFLAALGCGETRGARQVEEVRTACDALVPGTSTFDAAVAALPGRWAVVAGPCSPSLPSLGSEGGVSTTTGSVCEWDVQFYAADYGACSSGPVGGCWFGCVLRVDDVTWAQTGPSSPICDRVFYDPQVVPYIR